MFVIIAGGGRTGTQLAQLLLEEGHDVCVIEHRPEVLARLHKDIPTEAIFEGYATEGRILEKAGIRKAQVLAACMANDADNLVVCYLARQAYQVQRTIARINNPRNAWLFDKKFQVDVALNHSEVMARLIEEEMSLGDMMTLLKLRRGEYSLVEEKIPAGAKAIGVAIKDLALPEDCVIAAIIRKGKIVVPRGATRLEKEDEVLAITNRQGATQLSALFARPAEPV
jgi:trk system potassium uptake protein